MGWLKDTWNKAKGAVTSVASNVVGAVRSVTGGLAGALQNVASAAGSVASKAASTARGITGAVYDQIGSLAQKIGNTIETIASNPKMLAAVAVNFAFPGAGTAIGEWILGAETAAAVGTAATTAVGNACLNTAMNGGDMQKGIQTAVTSYIGNVGSQQLSQYIKNATDVPDALARNVGTTTTYAAIQAAMGKDPTTALLTGGANACAQLLTQQVPGFADMPKDAQAAITRATASALLGNTAGTVNAAIDYATKFAQTEYKSYKEANDNGFGYDPAAWKDAKAIGITDPTDYKYAKTVGADNPYDLQIAKAIGAKDNLDLSLAKDIGLTTAEDFDYAKQVGVNNKDDFNLAKDIGAQSTLDLDLAKTIGIDNSNDFNYAKQVGVNTPEDFGLAKSVGANTSNDLDFAKLLGIDNSGDFNYAKKVGVDNRQDLDYAKGVNAQDASDLNFAKLLGIDTPEDLNLAKNVKAQDATDLSLAKILGVDTSNDLNFAKTVGAATPEDLGLAKTVDAHDATDLGVAKQYGITDKDTLSKYSDFLGRGTEKASTTTIKGDDGSELTIDNEGNVVKFTYATDEGPLDLTKEVKREAARSGGYMIRGDDGSTLTINPNGTVSSTEAPDEAYAMPGEKRPGISYAQLVRLANQNRALAQQTEQGGVNEATAEATQRMRASPYNKTGYEVTEEDIASLIPLLMGDETQYQPQATEATPTEESGLAQVEVGGHPDIDYLAELGGKPSYLGSLEQPTQGQQVGPGKDAGALTAGAQFGPGVLQGGGGAGFERYVGGYGQPEVGGGPGQYGMAAKQPAQGSIDLIKTLQDAGLEDQSAAETARLLGAQGPVAIGRMPVRAQPMGLPVAPAPVADINTLPSGQQVAPTQTMDPLKSLQEYAASLGAYDPNDQLKKLQSVLSGLTRGVRQDKRQGTTAYKDVFGNIRTY